MHNLSPQTKTLALAALIAAAQAPVTTPAVDCSGFKGARFLVVLGNIAATGLVTAKVQGGALANGSDAVSLEGARVQAIDTQDGKLLIIDVHKPRQRYLRLLIERTLADSTITCVLAELHGPYSTPVAPGADVAGSVVVSEPYPV